MTLLVLPGVDHQGVYQVDAAAEPVEDFVSDLVSAS